jgi:energy-converting hydrogenase Eha subunit F
MIQYQQHMPQHLAPQHPQHGLPIPISQPAHVQPQYHQSQPQEGQWYENVAYQPPVEVVSHIQAYPQNNVFSDPWGPKLEYDDSSIQMPSARIESL